MEADEMTDKRTVVRCKERFQKLQLYFLLQDISYFPYTNYGHLIIIIIFIIADCISPY